MNLLVQAATQGDIDFLKTTTNTQHWYRVRNARSDKGQAQRVTLGVQGQFGAQNVLLKMAGVHIRR
jgi:hypothetical protein